MANQTLTDSSRVHLASEWKSGHMCELAVVLPEATVTDPVMVELSDIVEQSIISDTGYHFRSTYLRCVVMTGECTGELRLCSQWETSRVVATVSQRDYGKVHVSVAGHGAISFRMIPLGSWQVASVESRFCTMTSCGYVALRSVLEPAQIQENMPHVVKWLHRQYYCDQPPTMLLRDRKGEGLRLILRVSTPTGFPPSEILGLLAKRTRQKGKADLDIVDATGQIVDRETRRRCGYDHRKRSTSTKKPSLCYTVVYPRLTVKYPGKHTDCIHCSTSKRKLQSHDQLLRCVDCECTFKSKKKAMHHYAVVHSLLPEDND